MILKPTNILVYEWVDGTHACINLTEILPSMEISIEGFTMRQSTLNAAPNKVVRYKKMCYDNQHVYHLSLTLLIFNFIAKKTHINIISSRTMNII